MNELTFYRVWLLVPIALPILLMVLGSITPTPPEPWLTIWVYVTLSLPFGGMAYVVLAILTWRWLPGQSVWRIRMLALGFPLPIIAVNEVVVHGPSWFVVGITYGYVAAFLLTEGICRKVGWLRRTDVEEVVTR